MTSPLVSTSVCGSWGRMYGSYSVARGTIHCAPSKRRCGPRGWSNRRNASFTTKRDRSHLAKNRSATMSSISTSIRPRLIGVNRSKRRGGGGEERRRSRNASSSASVVRLVKSTYTTRPSPSTSTTKRLGGNAAASACPRRGRLAAEDSLSSDGIIFFVTVHLSALRSAI